jgi:hypothetical protein
VANKVIFEVVATSKGFEVVQKQQEKLSKGIDKTTESHKKLDKQQKTTYGRQEQGLIQTANGTKNFSKLAGSIGNDRSGLVGAYAALAANIFAATAAFNALRSAAQVDTLIQGFTFLSNAAGVSGLQIAEGLRNVTDNAISLEESLRASSIAITSGFNPEQIQRLGEVARNASIALGRNLGDSIDRLFRGVAKLEPEILDELGILVRLDTATKEYGASIGKTSEELTDFERRQAFLNATITQGELKYGALTDAIEPNAYDQLSAAFQDLTRSGLKLINNVFGPFLNLLAGSGAAITGGLILFGSTILTQIIPALGNMAQAQAEVANGALEVAKAEAIAEKQLAQTAKIQFVRGSGGAGSEFQTVANLKKRLKAGKADTADFEKALNKLRVAERTRSANLKKFNGEELKRKQAEIKQIQALQQEIIELQQLEAGRGAGQGRSRIAAGRAQQQSVVAGAVGDIQGAGVMDSFTLAKKGFADFRAENKKTMASIKGTLGAGGLFGKFGASVKNGFTIAGAGARIFGAALLNAIPVIGQIIFFGGLLLSFLKNLLVRETAADKALKNLEQTVGSASEKFAQLAETNAQVEVRLLRAGVAIEENTVKTIQQGNSLKVTSGILQEFQGNMVGYLNQLSAGEKQTGFFSAGLNRLSLFFGKLNERMSEAAKTFREQMGWLFTAGSFVKGIFTGVADAIVGDENSRKFDAAAVELQTNVDNLIENVSESSPKLGKALTEALKDFKPADLFAQFKEEGLTFEEASRRVSARYTELTTKIVSTSEAAKTIKQDFSEFNKEVAKNIKTLKRLNVYDDLAKKLDTVIKKAVDIRNGEAFDDLGEFIKQQLGDDPFSEFGISFEEAVKSIEEGSGRLFEQVETFKAAADATRKNAFEVKELNAALQALASETKLDKIVREFDNISDNFAATGKAEIKAAEKTAMALKANQEAAELQRAQNKIKNDLLDKEFELELLKLQIFAQGKDGKELEKITEVINKIKELKGDALISDDATATLANATERLKILGQAGTSGSLVERIQDIKVAMKDGEATIGSSLQNITNALSPLFEDLKKLGPEGEAAAMVGQGALQIASGFNIIAEAGGKTQEVLAGVAQIVSAMSSIMAASSKAQIAEIDKQIEAEKRRDGKSSESLNKMKALEAKKDAMAKKAFERNKKMQIAQTVINTASAIVAAMDDVPAPYNLVLAGLIGAMGAAQLAIIQKTQYQGSAGQVASPSTSLQIGGRSGAVDVAKQTSAGELNYLRGGRTTGQDLGGAGASFPGGAMGRRGYANGGEGIMVGERGPEVITPSAPVDITPNYALGGTPTNVNFSITTLDASGVEDVLTNQRGNIIRMIREAANENGEMFLESVDPTVYGGGG